MAQVEAVIFVVAIALIAALAGLKGYLDGQKLSREGKEALARLLVEAMSVEELERIWRLN